MEVLGDVLSILRALVGGLESLKQHPCATLVGAVFGFTPQLLNFFASECVKNTTETTSSEENLYPPQSDQPVVRIDFCFEWKWDLTRFWLLFISYLCILAIHVVFQGMRQPVRGARDFINCCFWETVEKKQNGQYVLYGVSFVVVRIGRIPGDHSVTGTNYKLRGNPVKWSCTTIGIRDRLPEQEILLLYNWDVKVDDGVHGYGEVKFRLPSECCESTSGIGHFFVQETLNQPPTESFKTTWVRAGCKASRVMTSFCYTEDDKIAAAAHYLGMEALCIPVDEEQARSQEVGENEEQARSQEVEENGSVA